MVFGGIAKSESGLFYRVSPPLGIMIEGKEVLLFSKKKLFPSSILAPPNCRERRHAQDGCCMACSALWVRVRSLIGRRRHGRRAGWAALQ